MWQEMLDMGKGLQDTLPLRPTYCLGINNFYRQFQIIWRHGLRISNSYLQYRRRRGEYQTTRPADNSDRGKGLVGPKYGPSCLNIRSE
jgi:hypothetical protein